MEQLGLPCPVSRLPLEEVCWLRMTLTILMNPGSGTNAARDVLDQLRQDAQVRDQHFAERMEERDAAAAAALADTSAEMMAKLNSLMKNMSASVDVKIQPLPDTVDGTVPSLEQRLQERWKTFGDVWPEMALNPDDKEAAICNAEFRIRRAVQQDEYDRRKKRMANEDKITSNAIETLRSDFNKMSDKMANEVVYLKNRHQGSAASTVSGSIGSGGSGWVTLRPGWCHKHS